MWPLHRDSETWLAAYVVHSLGPCVAIIFPAGESLHVYAYGHRILDPRSSCSQNKLSALVLTVPLACCNWYRQESSSRIPTSFVSVLRFGSFLALGGLSGRASGGALAAPVLEVAQPSSIYTSAVHALLCMASLFASTKVQTISSHTLPIAYCVAKSGISTDFVAIFAPGRRRRISDGFG